PEADLDATEADDGAERHDGQPDRDAVAQRARGRSTGGGHGRECNAASRHGAARCGTVRHGAARRRAQDASSGSMMPAKEGEMRVLVTGGAGFIGSHLVDRLLDADDIDVVVLDAFTTGKRANLPSDHPRLHLVTGDVADEEAVRHAMTDCDAVVHLAAVASVEASVRDPIATNRTNLRGTIRVFEEASQRPGRRVLYASSAAVYGDARDLPIAET